MDEAQWTALTGIIQTVIDVAMMLHELLILLPREAAEFQVFLLLENCFKDEWEETSVITTNALGSYEYRIEDLLEKLEGIGQHELKHLKSLLKARSGSVLAQAFIDRDSPLAWAVLAHEYGHTLDERYGVSRKVVGTDSVEIPKSTNSNPQLKWVAEVYADFVAARVLGPASLMPILLLELTRPIVPEEASTHPPTVVRVLLVRRYLQELGVSTAEFEPFFALYESEYRRKLSMLEDEEQETKSKRMGVIAAFLESGYSQIVSDVNSLKLRPFGGEELSHSKVLQMKLASDLPIASRRQVSDAKLFDGLNRLSPGAAPETVYDILSQFNEVEASSAEIVTAGWLHKLATFEQQLRRAFPAEGLSPKTDMHSYGDYLVRIDELLSKSLELASVHSRRQVAS